MSSSRRIFNLARQSLFMTSIFAMSGCAYLHSQNRDDQGQAVAKAAGELKLSTTIEAQDKKLQGLLTLELSAAESRMTLIREQEIRQIAFAASSIDKSWLASLNQRLMEIVGKADQAELIRQEKLVSKDLRDAEEARDSFATLAGPSSPTCEESETVATISNEMLNKIPANNRANAAPIYERVRSKCKTFLAAQRAYAKALRDNAESYPPTLLSKAMLQLELDRAEKDTNDALRKKAKSEAERSVSDYDKQLKQVTPPGASETLRGKLEKASTKLKQALTKVEATKFGREAVAATRLEHLENIISAVAGGQVDTSKWDTGLKNSVAVAGTLASLRDETLKNLIEAGRPRLVPYAMARDHQKLVVEEAVKITSILDRRIESSSQIVAAYQNEARALYLVKKNVRSAWGEKSLSQLIKTLEPPDEKRLLYEQLGVYFDDVPRFQKDQILWEYKRLATFHDESLEHSKYAALMWTNLIEGSANVLRDYHSSGIKPAELAEFIKGAALLYIGRGANK